MKTKKKEMTAKELGKWAWEITKDGKTLSQYFEEDPDTETIAIPHEWDIVLSVVERYVDDETWWKILTELKNERPDLFRKTAVG